MAYTPSKNVDAKTRNGLRAKFVKYDSHCWPTPWVFEIDGSQLMYSVGGFLGNHQLEQHQLDLISAWETKIEISLSTLKWWRELVDLNPSDLAPRFDALIDQSTEEQPDAVQEAARDEKVQTLIETAQWARNRLEKIADAAWCGDARDFKRSLMGVFDDFDKALLALGSEMPAALRALIDKPEGE